MDKYQCQGITKNGKKCKKVGKQFINNNIFLCYFHKNNMEFQENSKYKQNNINNNIIKCDNELNNRIIKWLENINM